MSYHEKYSEEELEAIDKYWGRVSQEEAIKKIQEAGTEKRSANAIKKYLLRLNNEAGYKKYPPYFSMTEEAKNIVEERAGVVGYNKILKELIEVRQYKTLKQLKNYIEHHHIDTQDITRVKIADVIRAFNVPGNTFYRMIKRGEIGPCRKRNGVMCINIKELWKSIKDSKLNTSHYDYSIGYEPEWLKDRIEKDKRYHKLIEDRKLIIEKFVTYRTHGYTNKQIAEKLGLDNKELHNIIGHKVYNNNEIRKRIDIKMMIAITEEEKQEMYELYKEGYKIIEIAGIYSRNRSVAGSIIKEMRERE